MMYPHKYENPDQLNEKQLWLLATSAMLSQLNTDRHDTLLPKGKFTSPKLVKNVEQVLSRDWEIKNLADLSDAIKLLHERVTFGQDLNGWEVLSGIELQQAVQSKTIGDYHHVMDMVQNYRFSLKNSDMAWHYGRCSWLIRESAFLKYISEEEAWILLEENGKKIKAAFSSWAEFGLSYMVGAQYWRSSSYTPDTVRRYIKHYRFLMTNNESPWKNVPWEVEL
ncbi:DUF1266 domain-containing protein [Galbibacter sp. EGI 63066]|uniref:DUF1266 domain-containing protein n=1 Tax=Galbibacter sp. EGI 63066 TaxID=2993559 RepID=UPI002248CC19|nr:DUF1266 domain-containing protein [Galbibacter sp. EGI 63066]MCX2681964.1 DUF1266 domain-containing protein [Galbibacter sp. EGI 63066]